MTLKKAWAATILLALLLMPGFSAQAESVDLELVLAIDVSRSIDAEEAALQREGYAAAFRHPAVVDAIRSGAHGRIAVAYVEWAGVNSRRLTIPWTVIGDAASGAAFSDTIMRQDYVSWNWTSISGAIDFSMDVFATSPHQGTRRVIDISGDGVNNNGRPAEDARDDALRQGVTINGLVIMNDRNPPRMSMYNPSPLPLDEFYRQHVVGGPGAFVIAINDFASFAHAIRNKLIREIAEAR